jgi:UTP--glucose-1-phosphate uridylyltransferase
MKAVITAAGLGTRLLPISKELPKEMLPIYLRDSSGTLVLKPLLQALFEQLYGFGIREFCFIVGRGKRAVEDHFTPDWDYVAKLSIRGKENLISDLISFYRMIENSTIVWVNQPEPKGFGHAVLMARSFVGNEFFIVCAGDTFIISKNNDFLKRMYNAFSQNVSSILLLQRVENPRQYGVAVVGQEVDDKVNILSVIEKPKIPPSNFAIMPFYIFNPKIFSILEHLEPGVNGEIQLTDAIQKLIDYGHKVIGVPLKIDELRLDIGTPETYGEAIQLSFRYSNETGYY